MSKNVAVIINFGPGNFEGGFSATLEIDVDKRPVHIERDHKIPPASNLPTLYETYSANYDMLGSSPEDYWWITRVIKPVNAYTSNHSSFEQCLASGEALKRYLSEWFKHDYFRSLRQSIQLWVNKYRRDNSVPVIFGFHTGDPETNNLLRKLPWHLWNLFKMLPQAEVALSVGPNEHPLGFRKKVRVLAIFGGNQGLEDQSNQNGLMLGSERGYLTLEEDEKALKSILKGAELEIVQQPNVERLQKCLRDEKGWDILLFSGHSTSDLRDGHLLISENHSISLSSLEDDFRVAIRNGLRLCIFNSCKGLGIADFFAEWSQRDRFFNLSRPGIIAMRESVPDFVARKFFRDFLTEFAAGTPIYKAVRQARGALEALHGNERPYPNASWLPVICLSRSQTELVWPASGGLFKNRYFVAGIAAAFVAAVAAVAYVVRPDPGSSLKLANMSIGDKSIIRPEFLDNQNDDSCLQNIAMKQQGTKLFEKGEDYIEARDNFKAFREVCGLDPETLIYLNNSEAILSGKKLIRIAVVVPIGDIETIGPAKEILRGVAQAQQRINSEGGVNNGHLIQVQIVNDTSGASNQYDLTTDSAEALSKDPAIVAVVGSYTSDITKLASEIYAAENLVSISPTSTAVRELGASDGFDLDTEFTFRTAPTDAKAAEDLVSMLQEYKSLGIIYLSGSDYSSSLKKQVEERLNIKPLAPSVCDLDSAVSDAAQCARELSKVEAVLMIPDTEIQDKFRDFVFQIDSLSQGLALFGGDAVYGAKTLQQVGPQIEGMRIAIPWHISRDNGQAQGALTEAKNTWGTDINWRSFMAFDAVMAIAGAIEQMDSTAKYGKMIVRKRVAGIQDVLKSGVFDGFLGEETIDFDSSGDRVIPSDPNIVLGTIVEVTCPDNCNFSEPGSEEDENID